MPDATDHDELLFIALLLTGFYGLLCLGELCQPDSIHLWDDCKTTKYLSTRIFHNRYKFLLPAHKTDAFFEGNKIVILKSAHQLDLHKWFTIYLQSRSKKFPLRRELWLTSAGKQPTQSFFISCLKRLFPSSIAGQSMRAGGVTFLAETGVAPHLIQVSGRWSSKTFQQYIRKNLILIHAMASCQKPNAFSL